MAKKLKKINLPEKRAQAFHREIEKKIAVPFSHPLVQKFSSCKKGCSACCHTQVAINSDEAELLATKVENGHQINLNLLEIQAEAGTEAKVWYQIPYSHRRCIFLDNKNACSIYEDRPAVCRTNQVLGESASCETKDGIEKPLRLVKTEEGDMVVIAAFQVAGKSGTLPEMLYQTLMRRAENRLKQDSLSSKKSIFNDRSM